MVFLASIVKKVKEMLKPIPHRIIILSTGRNELRPYERNL